MSLFLIIVLCSYSWSFYQFVFLSNKPMPVVTSLTIRGVECEPGLNGTYVLSGKFQGNKPQYMIPSTRRYVRFIRERWEIYVSHHPHGSTYFYHPDTALSEPPAAGWIPTDCAMSHESPRLDLTFEEQHQEHPAETSALPVLRLWSNLTCPFAQRVRILLLETGLQTHTEEILTDVIGDKSPAFVALFHSVNPKGLGRPAIPMLEMNLGHSLLSSSPKYKGESNKAHIVLVESSVICSFILGAKSQTCNIAACFSLRIFSVVLFSSFFQTVMPWLLSVPQPPQV